METTPLTKFDVTIKVGRKVIVWQRFGSDANLTWSGAEFAAAAEFGSRATVVKIRPSAHTAADCDERCTCCATCYSASGQEICNRLCEHKADAE